MDATKLAQLLYPNAMALSDLLHRFPERGLPAGAMVTRLGPSPTGFIHLGNLYGALLDEKLAHQSNGVVFLRIEDTDDKRRVEGAEEMLINVLHHFGIDFDEGVMLDGQSGEYGPYRQSERRDIYHSVARHLVEQGYAYPSFVTEEELEAIREAQKEEKAQIYGYFGKWATDRELNYEAIEGKITQGIPWVLRLKSRQLPQETIEVPDAIRGTVKIQPNLLDIVLIKSDGLPTYHFAHVVDDHLMRTTHVIRGEEWLSTLPVHLEIFELLGWTPPHYCHTAHLMKMEGDVKRKLSKRKDPELALTYYQELGYHPQAVKEYLYGLLQSNFEAWRTANPTACLDEFEFSLSQMGHSGALFDLNKLDNISKDVLLHLPGEDIKQYVLDYAKEYEPMYFGILKEYESMLEPILTLGRDQAKPRKDFVNAKQILEFINFYFDETYQIEDGLPDKIDPPEAKAILEDYLTTYDHSDTPEEWFHKIREIAQSRGYALKGGDYKKNPEAYKGTVADVSAVIRIALTGRKNAPEIHAIQQIIGETAMRKRLSEFMQ